MNMYQAAAHKYHEKFGFTCVPILDKRSLVNWGQYERPVTRTEIDAMLTSIKNKPAWECANGLNAICGVNDLTNIDFDHVTDEPVQIVLDALKLKTDWLVRPSGSGIRHIWLTVPGIADLLGKGKEDRNAKPEYFDSSNERHHIEIRNRGHYAVLSPSKHPSRPGRYQFVNGLPDTPPPTVDAEALLEAYALITVP